MRIFQRAQSGPVTFPTSIPLNAGGMFVASSRMNDDRGREMPSPDTILSGLASIANDWRWLAIGWHLWLAMLTGLLAGGWWPFWPGSPATRSTG
jgi:hypothetical protein